MPPLYNYCKRKQLVETTLDDVINYIRTNCMFALIAMVGYIILFRLVMLFYAEVKEYDNNMWENLHSPVMDRGDEFKRSRRKLDEVDGFELDDKIPCPQSKTNEDILVGIHLKTETKLASSPNYDINDVEIQPCTDS